MSGEAYALVTVAAGLEPATNGMDGRWSLPLWSIPVPPRGRPRIPASRAAGPALSGRLTRRVRRQLVTCRTQWDLLNTVIDR